MRSVILLAAAAVSVIVPLMVTRMKRPLIFADSLLPGPVKETGSAFEGLPMVTLADAVAPLPALSAKVTVTVAKPWSGNVKLTGLPARSGSPAVVQRIEARLMPEPPVSAALSVNVAACPARTLDG